MKAYPYRTLFGVNFSSDLGPKFSLNLCPCKIELFSKYPSFSIPVLFPVLVKSTDLNGIASKILPRTNSLKKKILLILSAVGAALANFFW